MGWLLAMKPSSFCLALLLALLLFLCVERGGCDLARHGSCWVGWGIAVIDSKFRTRNSRAWTILFNSSMWMVHAGPHQDFGFWRAEVLGACMLKSI